MSDFIYWKHDPDYKCEIWSYFTELFYCFFGLFFTSISHFEQDSNENFCKQFKHFF